MTNEAKKIARLRLLKKIGLIGLVTSGAIGLVFLILSLLPQGNAAFTIRIDNPTSSENSNFQIFTTEAQALNGSEKDSVTYLAGDPLSHAGQTTADIVEEHLDAMRKNGNIEGNAKFENDSGYELAMIYTIYLTNTTNEDVSIKYAVQLDAFKEVTEEMASPIEYFRVLVQTEEVDDSSSLTNIYYGQKPSGRYPQYKYEVEKEPIRTVTKPVKVTDPETSKSTYETHIVSDYSSAGNDGYCKPFNDYRVSKDIVSSEVVIPVEKVLRYTFVAFFDGSDVDSYVRTAGDNYLLLSLHFGV